MTRKSTDHQASGTAALYVRLSKEDREGKAAGVDSIAVQTADGTDAIKAQGWGFDPRRHLFVDDDVSGRKVERDGWGCMLDAAKRGEFSILVVREMSRVARYEPARQMKTMIELADLGVRVWTYSDRTFPPLNGAESIVTYAKAIASQQYVETIRTNAINAINKRALAGQAVKQGGLGYRIEDQGANGKRWVIVPEEAATVRHIAALFIASKSVHGTAKRLNEEGIATPWGASWRANGVTALLRRPLLRGFFQHGDVQIPHPELRLQAACLPSWYPLRPLRSARHRGRGRRQLPRAPPRDPDADAEQADFGFEAEAASRAHGFGSAPGRSGRVSSGTGSGAGPGQESRPRAPCPRGGRWTRAMALALPIPLGTLRGCCWMIRRLRSSSSTSMKAKPSSRS
jgi:DNA invertase Pin-like site-specific DNA recombinase